MGRASRQGTIYALLLAAQTAVASFLLWTTFPIFLELISAPGRSQIVDVPTQALIVGGTVALQCCYWFRFYRVAICAPFRSTLLSHLLMFASRVSFFFGGAFFSALLFRHVPMLEGLPPLGQAVISGFAVSAFLFALYCYSLELERLGKKAAWRSDLHPD
jgi:hypothetical protein